MVPFIIAGVAAGLVGVGKGIKAAVDNHEAKSNNELAEWICEESAEKLNGAREKVNDAISALGNQKLYVLQNSMNTFCTLYGSLSHVDLKDSVGLNELDKVKTEKFDLGEMKKMTMIAADVAAGVATGAGAGALTALGAWGAATTFATASTGTAIATLSGAAATNATLAFFGGGSLAAGGLGIAGGTAVLGGLIAGPALAIMGFVVGAKASKNLDNSYSNLAQAQEIQAEHDAACAVCNGIRRRSYMFCHLLTKLDALFLPLLIELGKTINKKGTDYSKFTDDQKHTVAACASVAVTIKSVIDTAILTSDGKLTDESKSIAESTQKYIASKTGRS